MPTLTPGAAVGASATATVPVVAAAAAETLTATVAPAPPLAPMPTSVPDTAVPIARNTLWLAPDVHLATVAGPALADRSKQRKSYLSVKPYPSSAATRAAELG